MIKDFPRESGKITRGSQLLLTRSNNFLLTTLITVFGRPCFFLLVKEDRLQTIGLNRHRIRYTELSGPEGPVDLRLQRVHILPYSPECLFHPLTLLLR